MLFANPIPPEIVSGQFYNDRSYHLSDDKLESDFSPVRYERELRIFRTFCKSGAVLDVGCSTGAFLKQIQTQFPDDYEVLGTDVAGKCLDHAEKIGIPVRRGPFQEQIFGEARFQAITFWAVLEHLAEPGVFLKRAVSLLAPGGCLFALVPNAKSLAVRMLGAKYRYVMPEHVNYFTLESLPRFILNDDRLELLAFGSSHFNPVVIWQDFRHRGEHVPESERGQLLKRTTAWKQNRRLALLKWVYRRAEHALGSLNLADNIWIVASRKP